MKLYFFIAALCFSTTICNSQVLKTIGKKVKDNVGWRAERRAGQEIDKGLDSLFRVPKKIKDKNTASDK